MSTGLLFLSAAAVMALTFGLTAAIWSRRAEIERRIASVVPRARPLSVLAPAAVTPVPRSRRRGPWASLLTRQEHALAAAGSGMTATQWLEVRFGAVAAAVLALLVLPVLVGLVVLALALLGPSFWLNSRRRKLRLQVERDLPDALLAISNGLRGGLSINQAIAALASEMSGPLGDIMREVQQSAGLGSTVEIALDAVSERLNMNEFHIVATAVAIQRQSGGNLSEVLDSVASVISEKLKLRQRVKSLTAEPRLSAWVLSLLPIGVGAIMMLIDPGFVEPLLNTMIGHMLLAMVAFLEFVGVYAIRTITRIE